MQAQPQEVSIAERSNDIKPRTLYGSSPAVITTKLSQINGKPNCDLLPAAMRLTCRCYTRKGLYECLKTGYQLEHAGPPCPVSRCG
jgi:hypothetical protein